MKTKLLATIALQFFGCAAVCVCVASIALAQPQSKSFYPAGGRQGATVSVTVSGSFPNWPVEAEILGDPLTLACEKDKGQLKVTIAKDAQPGPRWIRLHDAKGADAWRCFMIGQLAEVNETEPNELITSDKTQALPVIVNGKLQKSGDVDAYAIPLKAGETLVAAVDAKRHLNSAIDSVLQVCDERGFVLAQNDDNRSLDPLVVFTAPKDGRYQVRVFGFPEKPNSSIQFAGGADLVYRLTMTNAAFVDFALPLTLSEETANVEWRGWNLAADAKSPAPTGVVGSCSLPTAAGFFVAGKTDQASVIANLDAGPAAPQDVTLPIVISGEIEQPKDEDVFRFDAKKGQSLRIEVEAFDLGFALDPLVIVKDAKGKVIKELDDASRSKRDPILAIKAPADGPLLVHVRDTHHFGGPRYAYRLKIESPTPEIRLTTEDKVVAAVGKDVELTINVERIAGWKEPVTLSIEGLPAGVTAEPVTLDAKAKSGKLKLVAAKDAKPHRGAIRVVGKSGDSSVVADYTVGPLRVDSVWFTVTAAK